MVVSVGQEGTVDSPTSLEVEAGAKVKVDETFIHQSQVHLYNKLYVFQTQYQYPYLSYKHALPK